MKSKLAIFIVIGLLMAVSGKANARTDRELTYRTSQIWNSAVRFLRVEQRFKILEKDKEASYLLFEFKDSGKTYMASLELVDVAKEGRRYVRMRLNISDMPTYVEVVLADKFLRKLKDEYGQPPPARLVEIPVVKVADDEKASGEAAGKVDQDAEEDDLETTHKDLEDSVEED